MLEDLTERADRWASAACAEPRPADDAQRRDWVRELDLPFRTDPASVQRMKQKCARCPLLAECADASVGEEYGIWAGQLRHPRLEEAG